MLKKSYTQAYSQILWITVGKTIVGCFLTKSETVQDYCKEKRDN